jgi:purine nucleoside phosphorylase
MRLVLDSVREAEFVELSDFLSGNSFKGPRFPPVGHAYDRQYASQMKQIAQKNNLELREGVYCALGTFSELCSSSAQRSLVLGGPCYETIAEINLLRLLGCDAVGK